MFKKKKRKEKKRAGMRRNSFPAQPSLFPSPHLLHSCKPLWLGEQRPHSKPPFSTSFPLPELTVGTIKTLKKKKKKAEEQEEGSEIPWWWAINHKHSGAIRALPPSLSPSPLQPLFKAPSSMQGQVAPSFQPLCLPPSLILQHTIPRSDPVASTGALSLTQTSGPLLSPPLCGSHSPGHTETFLLPVLHSHSLRAQRCHSTTTQPFNTCPLHTAPR